MATEGTIVQNDAGDKLVLENGQWVPVKSSVLDTAATAVGVVGTLLNPLAPIGTKIAERAIADPDQTVRAIASGVTFGFADEISAALNSFISGGTYEENLQAERAKDATIPLDVQIGGVHGRVDGSATRDVKRSGDIDVGGAGKRKRGIGSKLDVLEQVVAGQEGQAV